MKHACDFNTTYYYKNTKTGNVYKCIEKTYNNKNGWRIYFQTMSEVRHKRKVIDTHKFSLNLCQLKNFERLF